ncbi:MAG: sulfatase, partial [Planctomycetia bacterium 21-64-5]
MQLVANRYDNMNPITEHHLAINRREFFSRGVSTIGTAALASLLTRDGLAAAASPIGALPGLPHFAAKAKRVIYLFQNGGPTHVELFDYKPKLKDMHGQPVPDAYFAGKRFSTMTGSPQGKVMLAPVEPFAQHGESGAWVSSFLPHTAAIADDL